MTHPSGNAPSPQPFPHGFRPLDFLLFSATALWSWTFHTTNKQQRQQQPQQYLVNVEGCDSVWKVDERVTGCNGILTSKCHCLITITFWPDHCWRWRGLDLQKEVIGVKVLFSIYFLSAGFRRWQVFVHLTQRCWILINNKLTPGIFLNNTYMIQNYHTICHCRAAISTQRNTDNFRSLNGHQSHRPKQNRMSSIATDLRSMGTLSSSSSSLRSWALKQRWYG